MRSSRLPALVVALLFLATSAAGVTGAAAAPSPHGHPTRDQAPSASDAKLSPDTAVAAGVAPAHHIDGIEPVAPTVDAQGRQSVEVRGDDVQAVADAVTDRGGEVITSAPGSVRALVPADQVASLAADSAVTHVGTPKRLQADVQSEGVGSTGAQTWQTGGVDGTGVKVGIVDVGFQNYASKLGTELPASVTTQNFCGSGTTGFDGSGPTGTGTPTPHGAAVAEIVHDMAPGASLYLVCVYSASDFMAAADYLIGQGVMIVNASIGSPLGGRGDGGSGAAAAAMQHGREAGQLWTVSVGNNGDSHFSAQLTDNDGDGLMQMFPGPQDPGGPDSPEVYTFTLQNGQVADIQMKWDAWPVTNHDLDLLVFVDSPISDNWIGCDFGGCDDQTSWAPPVEETAFLNGTGSAHTFYVLIDQFNVGPSEHADLYFNGQEQNLKSVNAAGSISEPATSPFVMAVGAACYSSSTIEPYSSQGPTIDGRTKPDITGPDGTSSSVFGAATGCVTPGGFTGTSAAAPHTAGAAALIKQANGALDASQIQAVLEALAQDQGASGKDSTFGAGLLRLGATGTPQSPAPVPYHGVAPVRVIDTRPQYAPGGGSHGDIPLGPGQSTQLTFAGVTFGATTVPANATAVVLNVTAANTTASSWFTVWPAGKSQPVASNLNFGPGQAVANSVTATIGTGGAVVFGNANGFADLIVDLVGWYAPAPGGDAGLVPVNPPVRALDSRSSGGPIGPGLTRNVTLRNTTFQGTPIPATATAVALNVTAVQPTASGWFTVFPHGTTQPTASSLNFTPGAIVPNLVIASFNGLDDQISFFNSSGNTNIVIDVLGYFMPGTGDGYVPLPVPTRDLDTRTGNGPRLGALVGGVPFDLDVGGVYGVPANAPAVLLNVTVNAPTGNGFLTVWPTGSVSTTSNLNFTAGQTVPNAVIASLGTQGRATFFTQATAPLTPTISDLQGYFYPLS